MTFIFYRKKNQIITKKDLGESYNCMLQMSYNDDDYDWKTIFEEKPKELSSANLDFKSLEDDVFKELTINIKKTKGKCIDEQFDQAIISLQKSKICE